MTLPVMVPLWSNTNLNPMNSASPAYALLATSTAQISFRFSQLFPETRHYEQNISPSIGPTQMAASNLQQMQKKSTQDLIGE